MRVGGVRPAPFRRSLRDGLSTGWLVPSGLRCAPWLQPYVPFGTLGNEAASEVARGNFLGRSGQLPTAESATIETSMGTDASDAEQFGMDLDQLIEVQEASLVRLLEWIRAVDTKVSVVMSVCTAMLGVLAALAPPIDSEWLLVSCMFVLGGACPFCGLVLCCRATFPILAGPQRSLIYFGGIAERTFAQYTDDLRTFARRQYFQDLSMQCHRNAEIAKQKYSFVRRALLWMYCGVVPWLFIVYAFCGS